MSSLSELLGGFDEIMCHAISRSTSKMGIIGGWMRSGKGKTSSPLAGHDGHCGSCSKVQVAASIMGDETCWRQSPFPRVEF